MNDLLKKGVPFEWKKEQEDAFQELKQVVQTEPVLLQPDQKKLFKVEIDASNYAIGAVLMQKDNKRILHPVAYFSKSLNSAQRNYDVYNCELLGLVETCRHFRQYLCQPAHMVKIHTNHANLLYWKKPGEHNRRVARWHVELMEYDFQLVHILGKKNRCADALSRCPDHDTGEDDNKKLVVLPKRLFAKAHARLAGSEEVDPSKPQIQMICRHENMWDKARKNETNDECKMMNRVCAGPLKTERMFETKNWNFGAILEHQNIPNM